MLQNEGMHEVHDHFRRPCPNVPSSDTRPQAALAAYDALVGGDLSMDEPRRALVS